MKTALYLLFILFPLLKSYSQITIGSKSEILNDKFNEVIFFDELNGYGFGGSTLNVTSDGGENWQRIALSHIPQNYIYNNYYLNASEKINDSISIIVGGNGLILKTIDKGQTWNFKSLMYTGDEIITDISFINDSIGFVIGRNETNTESFLFKTIDTGENWSKIETEGLNNHGIISFANEQIGFLGFGEYLYRTENGGLNWTQIQNPSYNANGGIQDIKKIVIVDDNKMLLSTSNYNTNSLLFISENRGESWQLISDLNLSNEVQFYDGIFEYYQGIIYMHGYHVHDRKLIKYNLQTQSIEFLDFYPGYDNEIVKVFVLDENTLYLLNEHFYTNYFSRKIIKYKNENWSHLDSFFYGYTNQDRRLEMLSNNGIYLASFINGYEPFSFNVFSSNDDGNSWKLKFKVDDKSGKILFSDGQHIKIITNDIFNNEEIDMSLHTSEDSGETWQVNNFPSLPNLEISQFYSMTDQNTLFFSFYNTIKFSNDNGMNWTNIPAPNFSNFEVQNNYLIKGVNEIYAWGLLNSSNYVLYKKINLGDWVKVAEIPNTNSYISTFFSEEYAIVYLGNNQYYKVDLINNNFVQIPFNHPIPEYPNLNPEELTIIEPNFWIINNHFSKVFYSTDQGVTWDFINCNICGDKVIYNSSNNDLILFGRNYGIERLRHHTPILDDIFGEYNPSINSIENYFIPIDDFSEVEWLLLSGGEIIEQDHKSARINWTESGIHTIQLRYIAEGQVSTFEFEIHVGDMATNEDNLTKRVLLYPNPFNNEINLDIPIDNKFEEIKIQIFDNLGKLVKEFNQQSKYNINISSLDYLPKGIYYMKIQIGEFKQINKLIKE